MNDKVKKLVDKSAKMKGGNKYLAEYLCVHERNVYRWLSGQTKPSAESVIAMCELVLGKRMF